MRRRSTVGGALEMFSLPLPLPNVTAHPSTASVPITVLLYNHGLLLCGFNVPMHSGLTLNNYLSRDTLSQPKD